MNLRERARLFLALDVPKEAKLDGYEGLVRELSEGPRLIPDEVLVTSHSCDGGRAWHAGLSNECVPCNTPTGIIGDGSGTALPDLDEFRVGPAIRGPRNWGTATIIVLEVLILIAVLIRGV